MSSLLASVCSEAATLDFGCPCLKSRLTALGQSKRVQFGHVGLVLSLPRQCHISSSTRRGDMGSPHPDLCSKSFIPEPVPGVLPQDSSSRQALTSTGHQSSGSSPAPLLLLKGPCFPHNQDFDLWILLRLNDLENHTVISFFVFEIFFNSLVAGSDNRTIRKAP